MTMRATVLLTVLLSGASALPATAADKTVALVLGVKGSPFYSYCVIKPEPGLSWGVVRGSMGSG